MLLAVMATWLLVGTSVAIPISSSSGVTPVTIDGDFESRSRDNETFSSFDKDNSITLFAASTNSTAVAGQYSAYNGGKTRVNHSSPTTASSRTNTSPHSHDIVNSIPVTSSTLSGYTSSSTKSTPTMPDYALTFAELLSAITAEFVFNVAGDHVLFPVVDDRDQDQRLHTTATIVAELLQKLHITPEVYRILNTTALDVAKDMRMVRRRGANPVAKVVQLTGEAAEQDPLLRDEYLAVKQRLANQIFSLPAQHGKFASTKSQTLYDVTGEQLAYAEKLMEDARVKKLIMSVTFFKASQFEELSVPEWVRNQTSLARAMFQLAKQPKWREEVQRTFDEAVTECLERYDAMDEDDEIIFQVLRTKIEQNAALSAELKKMEKFAQTNT